MWSTLLVTLLVLWQACFRAEALFRWAVDDWTCREFTLGQVLQDENDLLQWLRRHEVDADLRRLDLSGATLTELARLPLVFYEEYALRLHFEQIWSILKHQRNLGAYLQAIKEMAAFVEPGAIPNTITRPDGAIPWRRRDELSDESELRDEPDLSPGDGEREAALGGVPGDTPTEDDPIFTFDSSS